MKPSLIPSSYRVFSEPSTRVGSYSLNAPLLRPAIHLSRHDSPQDIFKPESGRRQTCRAPPKAQDEK